MSEKLPFQVRCLGTGQVIRFVSRYTTSYKEHWFLVLNANPAAESTILLSIFTSQVATVKAFAAPDTVVEIGPADFPVLTLPTCIDCNRLIEQPISSLIGERIDYSPGSLSPEIVARVMNAIGKSKSVSGKHKKMLGLS